MRHNNRPVLSRRREGAVALDDEVHGEAQLRQAAVAAAAAARDAGRVLARGRGGGVGGGAGVEGDAGDVVAAAHELLELAGAAAGVGVEDLHHVLLGVADVLRRRLLSVGRHVVRLVVVQQLQDELRRGRRHDRRRDHLVHGLVVVRVRRVVHEAGTGGVDVYEETVS